MRLKIAFFLIISLISIAGSTQNLRKLIDNYPLDSLFNLVVQEQSVGNEYFDKGIFPAYRQHSLSNKYWKDENLFFSEIILFTLGKHQANFSVKQQLLFDSIKSKALKNYSKFKNKDGFITYNFWKTKPSKHFPNSPFFSKYKKFQLPDDMDDTSIAYLTMDSVHPMDLLVLKEEMIMHTNQKRLQIKNIFKRYRSYQAYSTWFGKDMPIEFDICVLANTLYLVHHFKLELNQYDLASLKMLKAMISSKDHLKYSEYLSPNYKTNTLVLYHLSRFIVDCNPEILEPIIPQLVNEIQEELLQTKSFMEKVLLSSSLMRFGIRPENHFLNKRTKFDQEFFAFYVANMASMLNDPFKRWLAKTGLLSINYICPAYNNVLLIENKMLFRKLETNSN